MPVALQNCLGEGKSKLNRIEVWGVRSTKDIFSLNAQGIYYKPGTLQCMQVYLQGRHLIVTGHLFYQDKFKIEKAMLITMMLA